MTNNRFYFDTEFIEGFRKPIWWLPTIWNFNKKRWFIDLISIAIITHDGRKYYAISSEYNKRHANQWVKDNVIAKLPPKYIYEPIDPALTIGMEPPPTVAKYQNPLYKTNRQIAEEIHQFVTHPFTGAAAETYLSVNSPTFIAYYADYDWVLLCTLFGTMMNLPKGFPMYCYDLKQELDRVVWSQVMDRTGMYLVDEQVGGIDMYRNAMFRDFMEEVKRLHNYPKQDNEHDAEDDALFVKNLHNFIINYNSNAKV